MSTNILSRTPRTSVLLCLVCRERGHLASNCPNEWLGYNLDWFISQDREAMQFKDFSNSPQWLCERCHKIDLLAWLREDPPIQRDRDMDKMLDDQRLFRDLGTVGSVVLRDDCNLCRCIFGLIPYPSTLRQKVRLVLSWSMYRLEASMSIDTTEKRATSKYICAILVPSDTGLTVEDLVSTRGDGLCAVGPEFHGPNVGLDAREVDPDRLDLDLIRGWLANCERFHPVTCAPRISDKLQMICLIDANSHCLVPYSSQTTDYLALSYVWGNAEQNFPGAGRSGSTLGTLSQTIEDALTVVKDLGKQYLWVDSACIDQNDGAQLIKQIGIMSDIYQGAYATIIAFSGSSADAGLPRVGPTTTSYRQLKCSIDKTRLVGLCPTLSQLVWVMPWGNRSWTYQEAVLSPRCIYISRFPTHFECNVMACCETLDESLLSIYRQPRNQAFFERENWHMQVNTGVLRSPLTANMKLKDNALRLYSLCATLYSRRSMTKQSDAPFAFSGILNALEESVYKDGMFWALLWNGRFKAPRREGFPTWSWLSWQGHIVPGEPKPDGPQDPHKYPFDLKMWKYSSTGLEKIFETFVNSLAPKERRQLRDDPISGLARAEDTDCLERLRHINFPERERLLCVESFVLRFSPCVWIPQDSEIEKMIVL